MGKDVMTVRRRVGALLAVLCCMPLAAGAQSTTTETQRVQVTSANAAILRGLDKRTGIVSEIDIAVGETVALGRVQVSLGDCRYPSNNPAGDAFAWLVVRDAGREVPFFEGWMVASSPALNAMEHPRYDVWVIRCKT